jgi:hypothetical protein
VGLWNYIWLAAGDGPIPVFTALPVLYTIAESPFENLLESLHGSFFESLLESLLERASLREEYSFPPLDVFGQWQTLSLWKLWLIEASRSVEALAN